ncbi:MAG: hypothetical protein DSY76_03780 [Bacteroidetes bacterium]|nr:MAG: hypothetical protein DSY76_03780 [Bacteroidota bacterium]
MIIIYSITVIIVVLYALMIAAFTLSWIKAPIVECDHVQKQTEELVSFSVLIPFRNEEKHIEGILSDIESQSYPFSKFEVILINDDSDDHSLDVVRSYLSSSKLDYKIVQSDGGKKKAVETGLKQVRNEFIVSLDADVRIGKDLLQCYAFSFVNNDAKLIAAPVAFNDSQGLLSKLFSLEFMSLIVSGAAAINMAKPLMLNAANMAFKRSVVVEFLEQVYQSDVPSGDDQFLMEAIEHKYGAASIHFLKSKQAIATTNAPESIRAFFHQRVRWASKTSSYTSWFSKWVAILVFLINMLLLISFLSAAISQFAAPFLGLYLLKTLIDLPILFHATKFFGKQKLLFLFPFIQFIYPWYIGIVAVWSLFGNYTWKGREY